MVEIVECGFTWNLPDPHSCTLLVGSDKNSHLTHHCCCGEVRYALDKREPREKTEGEKKRGKRK